MDSKFEYTVIIEHLEKTIDRRQNITTIYLSVNAALLGVISFVLQEGVIWSQISTLALLLAGLIASHIWRRLLNDYNILLGWWYGILREAESELPNIKKIFTREYLEIYSDGVARKTKIGLTLHEIKLTWLFTSFYFGLGILTLMSLI